MKNIIIGSCLLILIIGALTPVLVYVYYNKELEKTVSTENDKIQIEIPMGASSKEIASILKINNIIYNDVVFEYYGRLSGKASNILAGKFLVARNLTIPEIYDALTKPLISEVTIKIPEGLRGDEIADKIDIAFKGYKNQDEIRFNKNKFLVLIYAKPSQEQIIKYKFLEDASNYEGFLFPDTYRVFPDSDENMILDKLLSNFDSKVYLVTKDLNNEQFANDFSYVDAINLASIVEREGVNEAERLVISSILLNRLNGKLSGIKLLQADATLLYDTKSWDASKLDKSSNSLYNSYKFAGLPPTAICNPGLESITSVFNSEPSIYLYYLHKNGKFLTAKTYSEHVANLNN